MKQNYSFDDVLLLPQYSDVVSRGDISLEVKLRGGINLSLHIV